MFKLFRSITGIGLLCCLVVSGFFSMAPAALPAYADDTVTISTSSLDNGKVGTAYTLTLSATGGTGSYTWAISSGSLPTGLTLTTGGVISGTPTTASICNFTILCSDTGAHGATKNFTMYISSSSSSSLAITATKLTGATVGAFYSATLEAVNGTAPYIWALASDSLPAGLTLSTSGIIFGTPTVASTYSFKVLVYDANSHLATKTFTMIISALSASTLAISTSSLANGTVEVNYSAALAATGGSGTYTWALSTGSLPDGLALSQAGLISGTPTKAATYTFTVLVYDNASNAITRSLSIIINPALAISTSSLSNGTVDVNYSVTLSATGGSAPYTWALATGNLPTGLTLSTAGVISGSPATATTVGFVVKATDSSLATADKALSITISPAIPLSVTTASLAEGKAGVNYSATLAASGGTVPYTWTLTDGALPAGLTLSTAGLISGIPTTAAAHSFVLTVSDSKSHSAVKTYSMNIAAADPAPATPSTTTKTTSASSNTTSKSGADAGKDSFDFTILIIAAVVIVVLLIIWRIVMMVFKKKPD